LARSAKNPCKSGGHSSTPLKGGGTDRPSVRPLSAEGHVREEPAGEYRPPSPEELERTNDLDRTGKRRGVPLLGDEGFSTLVRNAYRNGHLTHSEYLERLRLHGIVLAGRG
jgi:hypothetical protein